MGKQSYCILVVTLLVAALTEAWMTTTAKQLKIHRHQSPLLSPIQNEKVISVMPTIRFMADGDGDSIEEVTIAEAGGEVSKQKLSLEEKMKSWEASEEEIKAATSGGIVPEGGRSDAFDAGLWILFPLMVGSGLIFAFFPLLMRNIDVSNIEVPTS